VHVPGPIEKEGVQPDRRDIGTPYVGSDPFYVGGVARVRLYIHVETGSALTSFTVKLQERYAEKSASPPSPRLELGWVDTVSPDAAGTWTVEHAFSLTAGGPSDFVLVLDPPAIPDLRVLVKANAKGGSGDSIAVYMSVPL
jgi:hypothetical protein